MKCLKGGRGFEGHAVCYSQTWVCDSEQEISSLLVTISFVQNGQSIFVIPSCRLSSVSSRGNYTRSSSNSGCMNLPTNSKHCVTQISNID
jgi:hypothetical protein